MMTRLHAVATAGALALGASLGGGAGAAPVPAGSDSVMIDLGGNIGAQYTFGDTTSLTLTGADGAISISASFGDVLNDAFRISADDDTLVEGTVEDVDHTEDAIFAILDLTYVAPSAAGFLGGAFSVGEAILEITGLSFDYDIPAMAGPIAVSGFGFLPGEDPDADVDDGLAGGLGFLSGTASTEEVGDRQSGAAMMVAGPIAVVAPMPIQGAVGFLAAAMGGLALLRLRKPAAA
jgi:hypothetical protein